MTAHEFGIATLNLENGEHIDLLPELVAEAPRLDVLLLQFSDHRVSWGVSDLVICVADMSATRSGLREHSNGVWSGAVLDSAFVDPPGQDAEGREVLQGLLLVPVGSVLVGGGVPESGEASFGERPECAVAAPDRLVGLVT